MYEKSNLKFEEKEFSNPTKQYRGAPFWAWNSKLERTELLKQIEYFNEMGMGGFHIHSRIGLETEYLGEEFLEHVKACVDAARQKGMFVYLYDEDRWPSGFGGGRVTKNIEFRSRYLVFTSIRNEERNIKEHTYSSTMKTKAKADGVLLGAYQVNLEKGCLQSYSRCKDADIQGDNVWYLYEELAEKSPWYNNESYVDTLNPKAIEKFVEVTHEKYKAFLGEEFGKMLPSIFTDEPQFPHKTTLAFPEQKGDVILPYTDAFPTFYYNLYHEDFFDTLPEIMFETVDNSGLTARYRYHNAIAELFAVSYVDTIGAWCRKNNILLTGHMMMEENLEGQTKALGEVMRSYRSFGLPGIDMLCDRREYSTVKQAASAAHQYGHPGVVSEMYGVTDWDFDFRHHKLAGDWQACLGVTLRVPHLAWYSMKGEAKRDLPASIFYQSPWYKEYQMLEDYYARINTVMTRGLPRVKIAVIHPIETYWIYYGPASQTLDKREELEKRFADLIEWLLFSQLDFDFIAESLLTDLYQNSDDNKFHVGKMKYDVVIVPGLETIRTNTLKTLAEFSKRAGDVVVMGKFPEYMDGIKNTEGMEVLRKCKQIEYSKHSLVNYLEQYRDIEIRTEDGKRADCFIYQMREEHGTGYLFIANGKKIEGWSAFPGGKEEWYTEENPIPKIISLRITGEWTTERLNTMTGEITPEKSNQQNGYTYLDFQLYEHDSILLRLQASKKNVEIEKQKINMIEKEKLITREPVKYETEEDNVLMLDQADYCLDNGAWGGREELLQIDNILRKQLGYPLKTEAYAQPWAVEKKCFNVLHNLKLKFEIMSDIDIPEVRLAVEDAESKELILNGRKVTKKMGQYYVDHDIKTVWLHGIVQGKNILEIHMPYHEKTNIEWSYLLGKFGVIVHGAGSHMVPLPSQLCFGDIAVQGFPFYGGNLDYSVEAETEEGTYYIDISHYSGALIGITVDGRDIGNIAFSPYLLKIGKLKKGVHKFKITLFGNRRNTFGAVHNSDKRERWYGPDAWRTNGEKWSYEYQIKAMGILQTPKLLKVLP